MADIQYGQPAVLGQNVAIPALFVKIDETRRVVPLLDQLGSYAASPYERIGDHATVPASYVGLIPVRPDHRPQRYHDINLYYAESSQQFMEFPDAGGNVSYLNVPVTPGTDFYRYRRILAEHAHRFLIEHTGGNVRLTDPDQHRIETLAHELTNDDRERVGNVSEYIRTLIGYLWWEAHQFVQLPATSDAVQRAAWRARRDQLDVLIDHFCDACEGSGLSFRMRTRHDPNEWKRYLQLGVRFSVDRSYTAHLVDGAGVLTRNRKISDIYNFTNALAYLGDGFGDDDYRVGDFRSIRSFTTGVATSMIPPTPVGLRKLLAIVDALHWGAEYTASATMSNQPRRPTFRQWCFNQVAACLQKYDEDIVHDWQPANRERISARNVMSGISVRPYRAISSAFSGETQDAAVPFLYMLTTSAAARSTVVMVDQPLREASRRALADRVDVILGDRTVSP